MMELRRRRVATPQKPSRLQPTGPLHMTTRAASKAASDGGSSRRGSIFSNGHTSPMIGLENGGERYPKRRRVSAASKSTPTAVMHSSQSSSSRPSTRSISGNNLQSIAESPLPRKKRKRASDATAENISVAQPARSSNEFERAISSPGLKKQPPRKSKRLSASSQEDASDESESFTSSGVNSTADVPKETVEVSEEPQFIADDHDQDNPSRAGKDEANDVADDHGEDSSMNTAEVSLNSDLDMSDQNTKSEDSVEQSGAAQAGQTVPHLSIDMQGEDAEGDADDAEGDSEDDEDLDISRGELTLPQHLGIATLDPTPVVSATVSPTGSNQHSNADQESPSKLLTSAPNGDGLTASQDGDKPVKRLPGRRRAPHANPKVEAALRRQLHLRMAYRAVAKNLKPILTELAKRSLNNIHKGPDAHTALSEFPIVEKGLRKEFEGRLARVQKQKELDRKRLDDMLKEQTEMRRSNYECVARDIREDMIVRLQHDFLNTLRQQQQADDDEYSDDEDDDVVPSLRRVTAKGALRGILGPEYHWRSRPALETERLFEVLHERHLMAREHHEYDKTSAQEDPRPFTTFDPIVRDAAEAHTKVNELITALGEASEDLTRPITVPIVELPVTHPIIPNSEAHGLLMLAEASIAPKTSTQGFSENTKMLHMETAADAPLGPNDLSVPRPSMSRSESLATPAPSGNTPARPLEEAVVAEQRPPATVPISFSQAVLEPSTTQTAPMFSQNIHFERQEQTAQMGLPQLPPIGHVVASQSHAEPLPQPVATSTSLTTPTLSNPAPIDFWSSLARGNVKTDVHGKNEYTPNAAGPRFPGSDTANSNVPEMVKVEDRASRPSLPGSSTILEPLHQRLRSTSDSFGPLLNQAVDVDKARKPPAPKKSLYAPWPRNHNYNPLDRRASTTNTGPPTSLPGIHSRPSSGFGGPYSSSESRHTNYASAPPMPGFPPTSTAQSGGYGPTPIYGSAPGSSYSYEQRGPYPPMTVYPPPAGFGGMGGSPMQQGQGLPPPPPPPPPFYGGPHGLPAPTPQQGGYGLPPLASRPPPPIAPTYGPQYGGQPILPAGHDARHGPNGAAALANAGPAFAQYQQHDGRRRRNQSLGNREFQHYQGPR